MDLIVRVLAGVVWLLLLVLPDWLSLWLLNTLWPSWTDAVSKAMRRT